MRAALAVFVLSGLAVPVGAARAWQRADLSHKSASASLSNRSAHKQATSSNRSASKAGWLTLKEKFCMAQPAFLKCDQSSIIMVKEAYYQRRTTATCKAEQHSEEMSEDLAAELCLPASAADVVSKCSGQRECTVEPDEHPWCPPAPYTFFRAVWECVTGDPPTAIEDLQLTDNQDDVEEWLEVPVKKRQEFVKGEVDKLLEGPDPEREADLKPCYRNTRTSLVMSFQFFDPLTCCSANEGCFKVTFPNNKVYDDPDQGPKPKELAQAQYSEGTDSYWLSLFPIGLQRNDFNTWGVCLPKGNGKDTAIETFERLRKGKPKGKGQHD